MQRNRQFLRAAWRLETASASGEIECPVTSQRAQCFDQRGLVMLGFGIVLQVLAGIDDRAVPGAAAQVAR